MIFAIAQEVNSQKMIEQAAENQSVEFLSLTEEEVFFAALQEETPSVLFLEMGLVALDAPSLIQKLKQNSSTRNIPIVAFGNSLRADLLQDAQELGADLVLTKSAFREQISGLIRHYSKPIKA